MDTSQKIDWGSEESHLFYSPHLSTTEQSELKSLFNAFSVFPGHLWIPSSGSTKSVHQSLKLIAISKKAFLSSARSVNEFLETRPQDRWLQVLPRFHVGGLAIEARAAVGGFQVLSSEGRWNAGETYQRLHSENCQWISLVPTQLYDLVQLGQPAPSSLKGALMGGAVLEVELLRSALDLGYPVVESYGMTETCSLVAGRKWSLAELNSTPERVLSALSHARFSLDEERKLQIQTTSAFTGYAQINRGIPQFFSPEAPYLVKTQDLCWISEDGSKMKWLGRASRSVKILGEGVDLDRLQAQWQQRFPGMDRNTYISSEADLRKGHQIVLYADETCQDCKKQVQEWNQHVPGVHRIHAILWVKEILRSSLGKPLESETKKQLLHRENLIF
ncbi:MAG: AMP-binding protein [Proteobacteria bacterium]|nr:AMP-binding protein [Pseudomonadota bacterium]